MRNWSQQKISITLQQKGWETNLIAGAEVSQKVWNENRWLEKQDRGLADNQPSENKAI